MVITMKDYKEVIRSTRKKAGLSQYKLAKMVGITQSFMNEIESGKKSPSIEVFFRICEALNIRVFPDESHGQTQKTREELHDGILYPDPKQ